MRASLVMRDRQPYITRYWRYIYVSRYIYVLVMSDMQPYITRYTVSSYLHSIIFIQDCESPNIICVVARVSMIQSRVPQLEQCLWSISEWKLYKDQLISDSDIFYED